MTEDRLRILEMLKQGKISVEEADELLSAFGEKEEKSPPPKPRRPRERKFLRITVESSEGDDVRVNLPLSLAEAALNFLPREVKSELDENNIDLEMIVKAIEEDAEGELVNVESDGNLVRIYID